MHRGRSDLFRVVSEFRHISYYNGISCDPRGYSFYAKATPLTLVDLQIIYTNVSASDNLQWYTSSSWSTRLHRKIILTYFHQFTCCSWFCSWNGDKLAISSEGQKNWLRSCHHYTIKTEGFAGIKLEYHRIPWVRTGPWESSSSTPTPDRTTWKWNHASKSVVQTLLEHWQAWGHDHFPVDLILVLDYSLSEELFASIQSELSQCSFKSFPHILSLDTREKSPKLHTVLELRPHQCWV